MDADSRQPVRAGGARRAWALRIATAAVFAIGTAAIVLVVAGPQPSMLLHGASGESRISAPLAPDLVAGHTGWCRYGASSSGAGACVAVTAPLPTAAVTSRGPGCRFLPLHLAGLTSQWDQTLATPAATNPSIPRGSLLSCASSWYAIDGKVVLASILLNARQPSRPPPALPGFSAKSQRNEILELPASDLSARALGQVWLVVRGGTAALRAALLRTLDIEPG